MKTKFIPVEESFKQWKKDPKYVAAYNALEKEFAIASAMIKARADANMTQEQVAKAMGLRRRSLPASKAEKLCPRREHLSVLPKPPERAYASALHVRP